MRKNNLSYIIRDWTIIVLFFAIAFILISLFSWKIYLSDKIGGGYLNSNFEITSPSFRTVDKKRLQGVISIMEEKQKSFLEIKNFSSRLIDPSR